MYNCVDIIAALIEEGEERKEDNCLLNKLPNDLLINIFRYLSHSDLRQIRLVCKYWYNLTKLPEFVKKFKLLIEPKNCAVLSNFLVNDKEYVEKLSYDTLELHDLERNGDLLLTLKCLGPNIRKLYLRETEILDILYDYMPDLEELSFGEMLSAKKSDASFNLKKFKNLKSLDITCLRDSESIQQQMMTNLTCEMPSKMEKLGLHAKQEDLLIDILLVHSSSLKYLEITFGTNPVKHAKWKQVFVLLRRLETLKISGYCNYKWLALLIEYLPEETFIRHLDLSGVLTWNDSLFKLIVYKSLMFLETLELRFCGDLTDEGLKHLSMVRQTLRSLTLSNCSTVSLKGLQESLAADTNTVLKTLIINDIDCKRSDTVLAFLENLPELTYLDFQGFRYTLLDITLHCISSYNKKLQHILLHDCRLITVKAYLALALNPVLNKGLRSLSLWNCRNLTNYALKSFKFPELRKLVLCDNSQISADGIEALVSNCCALEDITIVNFSKIEEMALMHIVNDLPQLRNLKIFHCFHLTGRFVQNVTKHLRIRVEFSGDY